VRVAARSREEGFALRPRLRDVVSEAVLPSLEQAFDELAPGDEIVHVPRLELRAAVSDVAELARVLPELVRRELAGAIAARGGGGVGVREGRGGRAGGGAGRGEAARAVGTVAGGAATVAAAVAAALRADKELAGEGGEGGVAASAARGEVLPDAGGAAGGRRASGGGGGGEASPEAELRSVRGDRVRGLARYLETGAFPWYLDGAEAIREAIAELSIEELARAAASAIARSPNQIVAVGFRLLQLVPPPRWAEVARAILAATGTPASSAAIDAVTALAGASAGSRHALLRIAAAVIALAHLEAAEAEGAPMAAPLGGPDPSGAARAIAELVPELLPELERLPPVVAAFLRPRASTTARPGVAAPDAAAVVTGAPAPSAPPPSPAVQPPRAPAAEPTPLLPPRAPIAAPSAVVEPFGIPARHAGLILLHPFLARLFENARIKAPGRAPLDPPALPRAAALLHACAAGNDEPFEHDLAFIKILLGLASDDPLLVAGGLLSDADRQEIEDLLRAVIDHWTVLKRTSPQGLRATFLRRGGLVREEAQGFRLQVEPAGFDVLLPHLPWGIATVKLPWMAKPIFTEWPLS
jgi:hypothetical protein